ncbi:MAG: HAMP domain-containing sensor histidine kinase [Patescibacteria group bacterium]
MNPFDEKFFLFRWLRKLPIPRKLDIFIGIICITVALSIVGFWFGMETLSAMRAYVGGESVWSKSQKNAIYSLMKYSLSYNEKNYNDFREFLKVPLGDKKARLELEKDKPDYSIVREGFTEGGIAPEDINEMAALFRRFRNYLYMDKVISIWAEGDKKVDELILLGDQLHTLVTNTSNTFDVRMAELPSVASIITRVDAINNELTTLEQDFSFVLGEGSRHIKNILLTLLVAAMIIVGLIAIALTILLSRMITRIDRAKSEFVSLASHQLRTPLTIINWYSEKLLRDYSLLADTKRIEYVKALSEANERMGNLVDSLLSASQIDLGKFAINPETVDLGVIVERVFKDLQPQIQKKNIKINIQKPTSSTTLLVDIKLVEMIFQNLLSNAIKYTPDNGMVSVTLIRQINGVLFKVADTGYGINSAEQPKIFDKLFRSQAAQVIAPGGTGLGLYITKSAVERCGGKIWFQSAENKGTTFYVIIPNIRR